MLYHTLLTVTAMVVTGKVYDQLRWPPGLQTATDSPEESAAETAHTNTKLPHFGPRADEEDRD